MSESGHIQKGIHYFNTRVYYEDTDAGGVVYHSNYLNFAERARTEFLRFCDIHQEELKRLYDCVFVVTELNIKYKKAARLDDIIQVRTEVEKLSKASLMLDQTLWILGEKIVEIKVSIVAVDSKLWRLKRLPEMIIGKLKEQMND
ncbi:tol-pal system-associated acyl-CoA thioesterase [Alphaproteobacteria bacterium]|jgi:acyl-CoA thioester hydrolase|nr:tol-pal system-associated acyl-CoA thioesterase [Alphaproteobacteria bacterium]